MNVEHAVLAREEVVCGEGARATNAAHGGDRVSAWPKVAHAAQKLEAELGLAVETGEFGASMQVALINDGPVTITIDSKNRE